MISFISLSVIFEIIKIQWNVGVSTYFPVKYQTEQH